VPNELVHHPSVVRLAERKKRGPATLILDQTYHHSAILRLGKQGIGRGRPDIAHLCLLLALGSPLNMSGQLRCFIHTRDNKIIRVDPKTRLPRNTDRFTSLLEQLYQEKRIPQKGHTLLTIEPGTIQGLLGRISGTAVALTTQGSPRQMDQVAIELSEIHNPIIIVGGFPEGHFSKQTLYNVKEAIRIHPKGLEAPTVVARAIYDYEKAIAEKHTGN